MYEVPPSLSRLACPACSALVKRIWQPSCAACGVEFSIDAPWWMIAAVLAVALAAMVAGTIIVEVIRLAGGTGLIRIIAALPLVVGWVALNIWMTQRWGRLVVKP